ncbi:hypothetical protein DFH06DRAFT_475067 [Mycena polygramma]|nr:hypothetical protein DFH06DRAFT_475067 [Mycena polygramma]
MHPSLGLQNLRDLPPALYAGAIRAANGSLEDLKPLVDLVVKTGSLNQGPLVPVFYVNLNPAPDIPSQGGDLASISNTRGILALHGLHAIRWRVPKEAAPEVWPRVWKWVSFLHAYHDAIPDAPTELTICGDFLIYLCELVNHSAHLVASTPRARVFIVHGWKLALEEPNKQSPSYIAAVGRILTKVKMADPPNLVEFIEGAGGTLEAAAALLTRSLNHFFPTMHTGAGAESFKWLEGVFYPLHDLMVMREARDAMVEAGLVTSLIKVLYAFSTVKIGNLLSRMIDIDIILRSALLVLRQIFKSYPQEWVLREAVDSGLLRTVVACGFRKAQPVDVTASFLTNTLTRCTLYYPILLQMAGSLRELQDYTRHPAFVKSSIFSTWTNFQTLLETRAALAKPRRSPEYISRRPCNNIQCGEIRVKTALMRCGGCQVVYYCSFECQKHDWTHGGHRTHCDSIRTFFFRNVQYLTPQHISFLRALVHADYMADKYNILCRQLACYRTHPSALVVTVFDYATGHARIDAHPAPASMKKYPVVNWREHLPRALQSAGLMELHLAVLPNSTRAWVFPLRSNSPVLQDRLREIAASTTALTDSAAEVRVLVDSTRSSLMQIHQ